MPIYCVSVPANTFSRFFTGFQKEVHREGDCRGLFRHGQQCQKRKRPSQNSQGNEKYFKSILKIQK
jgi:hypothetical protein